MTSFTRALLKRISTDNISFLAGGVAFYGLLALFPAVGAVVAVLAIAAKPRVVREQLEAIQALFPAEVYDILHTQILSLVKQSDGKLGTALVISLVIALSSATRGTKALLAALNTIFRVRENRKWWRHQLVSIGITCGGIALITVAFLAITALPILLQLFAGFFDADALMILSLLRWLLLGGAMFIGVLLLYAFGPNIPDNKKTLREELIGTIVASASWLTATIAGSWVLGQVPQLHAAYGSLSAVVVLMLWMVASAYCLLLGAAVTATLNEWGD
jgi:membrane protein